MLRKEMADIQTTDISEPDIDTKQQPSPIIIVKQNLSKSVISHKTSN
jgi:hypothetical protein